MKRRTTRTTLLACTLLVGACPSSCESPSRPLPLLVFDTATGKVIQRIKAPDFTYDVAIDNATGDLWIVSETQSSGYQTRISRIAISSTSSPVVTEVARLDPSLDPDLHTPKTLGGEYWWDYGAIAIDSTNRRGAFTSPRSPTLLLVDLDTFQPVRQEETAWLAHGVAFASEERQAFATGGGVLYSFDSLNGAATGNDLCAMPIGSNYQALGVVHSASRHSDYAGYGGNMICAVDEASGTHIIRPYDCGLAVDNLQTCYPMGMALSRDESRLFVASPMFGQARIPYTPPAFSILDLNSNGAPDVVVHDLSMPQGFAISPDGTTLYVSEVRCDRVGVYDALTGAHRYDLSTSGPVTGIDISADGKRLYVTQQRADGPFGYTADFVGQHFDPCPPAAPKPP